jgi:hypothetical protein
VEAWGLVVCQSIDLLKKPDGVIERLGVARDLDLSPSSVDDDLDPLEVSPFA